MYDFSYALRRPVAGEPLPRVAVLMGGPSREAEVSIRSGMAIAEALRGAGFTVDAETFRQAKLPKLNRKVEVVFPALHGQFGEDGQIQELLERAGLPYVGSNAAASRIIMDKDATKRCLEQAGLPVIPGECLDSPNVTMPRVFAPPVVIKPATEGSTIGLTLVERVEDWMPALENAFKFGDRVLVERYIKGVEITVGLLDGHALPVVEIVPPGKIYDYDAKYTYAKGKTEYHCPPRRLSEAQQEAAGVIAEGAWKALGARDMLRIDIIFNEADGRPLILEGNSIPGFTATSLLPKAAAAAGVGFAELCTHLVLSAASR